MYHPSTRAPKYTCTQVHVYPCKINVRNSKNEIVFLMLYLYAGGSFLYLKYKIQNTKYCP